MNAYEILNALRKLLEKPESWTQGTNARTSSGESVSWDDKDATCWCLNGGLMKVASPIIPNNLEIIPNNLELTKAGTLLNRCSYEKVGVRINNFVDFNDTKGRQHPEILSLIDCAIEHAKEAQPA